LSVRNQGPIDWTKATEAERSRLYLVAKAIMDNTGMSPSDFYRASLGKLVDPVSTSGNFQRGKIGRRNAALVHAWIAEHHLSVGLRVAPELFIQPARTSWQGFLDRHTEYGQLSILRLSALGLVQPASRFPIEERPIPLGERFAFSLRSARSGSVFAFQETRGLWYLFPLGEDHNSFIRSCSEGDQVLPSQEDGSPLPLVEAESDGLHSFVFIVCAKDADIRVQDYAGLAMRPEQLDELSSALSSAQGMLLGVYRVNVRFVR
jgi:hypothetical protein